MQFKNCNFFQRPYLFGQRYSLFTPLQPNANACFTKGSASCPTARSFSLPMSAQVMPLHLTRTFYTLCKGYCFFFCIVAMPVIIECNAYIFHKSFAKKVKPFVYRFKYLFSYIVIGNAYFLHSGNACGNSKYGLHF